MGFIFLGGDFLKQIQGYFESLRHLFLFFNQLLEGKSELLRQCSAGCSLVVLKEQVQIVLRRGLVSSLLISSRKQTHRVESISKA